VAPLLVDVLNVYSRKENDLDYQKEEGEEKNTD